MGKKLTVGIFAVGIIAGSGLFFFRHRHQPVPPAAKPVVAIQPATRPTTRRVPTNVPAYMDLIRAANPLVATTQPLAFAVDLPDAVHLLVHDPVYLDPSGHLWFTRVDGDHTAKALRNPADSTEHVIRDAPVYVHWWTTDAGKWAAAVVVRSTGGYDLITESTRQHLAGDRPFRWGRAFSIIGKIVVPTDVGVSVFDVEPRVVENYHRLPGCTGAGNAPVAITDTRGILAWAPWERGRAGSRGVSRFVDGRWDDLSADQWPARPIQLSVLLDGTVLRLAAPERASTAPADTNGLITTDTAKDLDRDLNALPDHINLSIGQLEPLQIDSKHVDELIAQLDDPDGEVRQAAFEELSRYGPSLSPLLEKAVDQQRPEGQMRIRQLLKNQLTPALGGLMPVDGRLSVARRYDDGTVLFFAPAGVRVQTGRESPDVVAPAWITQRPDGRMDRPLPTTLVRDQNPEATTLVPVKDEWLVCDAAGVRRFFGNTFEPLLRPDELQFSEIDGIGLHRRWIFRVPTTNGSPVSPATTRAVATTRPVLIIDPMIADPTPKLPVWTITVTSGMAGWDAAEYPVVVKDPGGHWELSNDDWKALPPSDRMQTADTVLNPKIDDSSARPSTGPTTAGTLGKMLLVGKDATRYFDGQNAIVAVGSAGRIVRWPLPAAATGTANPVLIQTADRLLFLYNQPGRLLRIKPTPGSTQPFELEATFTAGIPDGDNPVRIWLDPAGRIDWISDGKTLSVMFPDGHVPKSIANMMLDAKP